MQVLGLVKDVQAKSGKLYKEWLKCAHSLAPLFPSLIVVSTELHTLLLCACCMGRQAFTILLMGEIPSDAEQSGNPVGLV